MLLLASLLIRDYKHRNSKKDLAQIPEFVVTIIKKVFAKKS
jgi:hypothetical protein